MKFGLRSWRLLSTEPSVTHHRACFREKEKVNDVILGTFPTRWGHPIAGHMMSVPPIVFSSFWNMFLREKKKFILSITYSFYLNATREKGEIIVILLIVEVLKQSLLFGHLTEYFIFCLSMVCVKIFDFNLYYILIAKLF